MADSTLNTLTAATYDAPDGGVIVDFAPSNPFAVPERTHNENLSEFLDEMVLSTIAGDLLEGIESDDGSRTKWLAMRKMGIDLLALEVAEAASGSTAFDGMAAVKHPLLLEACLRFQANAVGELLPSTGPVKVESTDDRDDNLAKELGKTLNAFLRLTATEYYPDTDKLLFGVGFSGAGFKKGYSCPLRQRPVLESVDAADLIISNSASDLESAPRVTHRILMDKATFIRMQIAGAYRRVVDLSTEAKETTVVEDKIASTQGLDSKTSRTQDEGKTIYECYCTYDIPGYEHLIDGEPSGLPLPYKITIDKVTKQVLEIRRNWKADDADFTKRRNFVMYPFVPMFGLYPYGLLHILGNTTSAITSAWRILLDSGMFANFPGFMYLKGGVRQEETTFRVGPGEGAPINGNGADDDIRKLIMPLPYKEPGPATMQLVDNIASTGRQVGGTTEIKIAEGNAQTPVGTTLAMIEQAAVIVGSVHKRLHTAQFQEFQLLKDLLSEDPDALWRHRKGRDVVSEEKKQAIIAALNDYDLAPMSDPNVPSHIHRLAKCMAVKQLAQANPEQYNMREVDAYCLAEMGVSDFQRFFADPQPQPNPVQVMAAIEDKKIAAKTAELQITHADKEADRLARLTIEREKIESREDIERAKIAKDMLNV